MKACKSRRQPACNARAPPPRDALVRAGDASAHCIRQLDNSAQPTVSYGSPCCAWRAAPSCTRPAPQRLRRVVAARSHASSSLALFRFRLRHDPDGSGLRVSRAASAWRGTGLQRARAASMHSGPWLSSRLAIALARQEMR